jgi:hypothetical protein
LAGSDAVGLLLDGFKDGEFLLAGVKTVGLSLAVGLAAAVFAGYV